MARAVLLVGGWAHPGDDLIAAVGELVGDRAMELVVVTAPHEVPATLATGCDLLIVGACWFSMADARYSADQRHEHAVVFTPELAAALEHLRDRACPVLALHTAVICFDGNPIWRDWLGGTWNWETSWHPAPADMEVKMAPDSPIHLESFTVIDECYQRLSVTDRVVSIATSALGDPLVWLHQPAQPSGRAAVNLLGHDHRSLSHPSHRALNARLLDWLLESWPD